jgi:parallel beta-helix repeat protein
MMMKMKKLLIAILSLISLAVVGQRKDYVITAYGAKPDGITNNVLAIQKAIDEANANGGGRVVVPRGRFVTGVIHLKSNVELNIHAEAVLLASINRNDYGTSLKVSAWINADDAKNVAITGKGLIDGQCDLLMDDVYKKLRSGEVYDDEWKDFNPWHQRRPSEKNRPRMIQFRNCDGVTIKNIRLQNSTNWVQDYENCNNILIDSIDVFSNTYWNNDGIDLTDSKNARIMHCNINAADDGICLKSSDRNNRCENIFIADCRVRSSASAVKLGTASHGGFKNIVIRNIEVYDTYRSAIAIESVDGGLLEDIDVRNINAVNTGNAFFIRLGHRNKDAVYSRVKNIYIGNIKVQVPTVKPDKGYPMEGPELKYPSNYKVDTTRQYESVSPWNNSGIDTNAVPYPHNVFPSAITGIPGHNVENVQLENIEIVYEGGGSKDVNYFPADSVNHITEAENAYPEFSMFGELPCYGLYVRHVKGLTMKNVSIKTLKPDFRTAGIFNDVDGLKLNGLKVNGTAVKPVLILNNVKNYSAVKLQLPVTNSGVIKVQ